MSSRRSEGARNSISDEELRRTVLAQTREIRELRGALEEEKKRNELLQQRVSELELQLQHAAPSAESKKPAFRLSSSVELDHEGLSALEELLDEQSLTGSARVVSLSNKRDSLRRGGGKRSNALQRTGLREKRGECVEAVELPYSAAIQVLRWLEKKEVGRLCQTNLAWAKMGRQYLSEWRRTRLVLELAETERTYLLNLRRAVEEYLVPKSIGTKFLTDEEAWSLFANTEELLAASRSLYASLRALLLSWDGHSRVGEVFSALADAPRLYRVYAANQCRALEFAEQLRFELRICDGDWRHLESFLILPIQRVPRYQMLLREIAAHTAAGHGDEEGLREAGERMAATGRAMEAGMEEAMAEKRGREVMGAAGEMPAWMGESRCRKMGEARRRGQKKKSSECLVMLCGNAVVLCDQTSKAAATIKNSAAAIPKMGGKTNGAAAEKQWKYVRHYSCDVLRAATEGSTLTLSVTGEADSTSLRFETKEECAEWAEAIKSKKTMI